MRLLTGATTGSPTPPSARLFAAWAHFTVNGGTPVIQAQENVLSVTDNGVGDFTFTWQRQFAATAYAVVYASWLVLTSRTATGWMMLHHDARPTVSSVRTQHLDTNTIVAMDPPVGCIAVVGRN